MPTPPSLVAHTGGYKIVVGTYNTIAITVECQMHIGGRAAFFRDGGRRYLQILFDALESCEESHYVHPVG